MNYSGFNPPPAVIKIWTHRIKFLTQALWVYHYENFFRWYFALLKLHKNYGNKYVCVFIHSLSNRSIFMFFCGISLLLPKMCLKSLSITTLLHLLYSYEHHNTHTYAQDTMSHGGFAKGSRRLLAHILYLLKFQSKTVEFCVFENKYNFLFHEQVK